MTKLSLRIDGMLDPDGKYPNPLNGLPYSKHYRKFAKKNNPNKKGWAELKAYEDRYEILNKIHEKSILLVSLPTGTGKTVIVPRLLFHYFGYTKKIFVTTPRQTTTSLAGEFAAKCFDVPLFELDDDGEDKINPKIEKGKENRYPTGNDIISYRHGKNKELYNDNTKLIFTTDGTVKSIITGGDIDLEAYGGIVIDEIHERSVSIDILIALVMDILTRRKDFKIIFMSATMDLTIFTNYFKKLGQEKNYNIYKVEEGKTTFDINYIKEKAPLQKNANKIMDVVYKTINSIMFDTTKVKGDILAFVASESETDKIKKLINKNLNKYSDDDKPYALSMSSKTKDDEQTIATSEGSLKNIAPTKDAPKGYSRKIIIATPTAESSITFGDPLKYVIDTGISYSIHYDADKYCYIAGKNYITQSSIKQRCGRTGRTCPGSCVQLYTLQEYNDFKKYITPEILNEDITIEILNIMKLRINNLNIIKALQYIKNMIEPIQNYTSFLTVGVNNIKEMDFIDKTGTLTELGNICSEFMTFDIKIAKMIIGGYYLNCISETIMLGAILHIIKNFSDIFKSMTDEIKNDPVKSKHYENNIKKFIKKEGEHISLLVIYNMFISNKSSWDYAEQNNLNYSNLMKIQEAHNELICIIYKQDIKTRLNKLNRFINIKQFTNTPNYNLAGGSLQKKYTPKIIHKTKKIKKTKKNIYNVSRKDNKINIQNINSNITKFHRYFKNGGRIINKHGKYKTSRKHFTRHKKYKSGNNNSIIFELLDLVLEGGGSAIDKNTERRKKYMELFTLSDFQKRKKSIELPKTNNTDELITRIVAALYYGFSTNIACYSGSGKDYNVKFSKIKGTFVGGQSKSCFDYVPLSKEPDWIIYHSFIVKKDFGKEDKKGTLNIVTILEQKHLSLFFDLEDIKKQVVTEIK